MKVRKQVMTGSAIKGGRYGRSLGNGDPGQGSPGIPKPRRNPETFKVLCWCKKHTVGVTREVLLACETGSCASPRCRPPEPR